MVKFVAQNAAVKPLLIPRIIAPINNITMLQDFSSRTVDALKYYVYLLVDPRDGKIFYVGKGKGDRVFAHLRCAESSNAESEKLNTIREIQGAGKEVLYYIARHGLDEDDAFLVESVLIDLLTFRDFASVAHITNIQAGHHQFDRGIKTAEELEALYNGGELEEHGITDRVLTININGTYNLKNENHPNIYEATRKSWKLSPARAKNVQYVLSEYRGVVRAIFAPYKDKWMHEPNDPHRWLFEGYEITEENNPEVYHRYINKHLPKAKGTRNPIHYYNV